MTRANAYTALRNMFLRAERRGDIEAMWILWDQLCETYDELRERLQW